MLPTEGGAVVSHTAGRVRKDGVDVIGGSGQRSLLQLQRDEIRTNSRRQTKNVCRGHVSWVTQCCIDTDQVHSFTIAFKMKRVESSKSFLA